jgi:hypothetical protein
LGLGHHTEEEKSEMTQAPTSNTPYSQEASREEKAAILKVETDRAINTLRAYTNITDPVAGGRFAKALGEYTVGATPTVEYPRLPENSPSHHDPLPDEMPLGFSVDALEPTGELHELQEPVGPPPADSQAEVTPPSAPADLPPLLGSAPATSLPPEPFSPIGSDARVVASPTSSSSRGSSDPSFTPGQQLAAPLVDAEASRKGDTPREEHRRGGAVLSSKPSFRRIG